MKISNPNEKCSLEKRYFPLMISGSKTANKLSNNVSSMFVSRRVKVVCVSVISLIAKASPVGLCWNLAFFIDL